MKKLDPGLEKMLAELKTQGLPNYWTLPVPEARQVTDDPKLVELFNGKPIPIYQVEDQAIDGPGGNLILRVYTPRKILPNETLPIFIFIHGGGWVIGSLDMYEAPLHYLSKQADCIIVSVDYRLAPEHPFPAAVEDCMAATQWVAQHAKEFGGDPTRIAIGGDSAGGNLAAVTTLVCRDKGGPHLNYLILIYPVVVVEKDFPSRKEYGQGYFITTDALNWFNCLYFTNRKDFSNPLASPLLAADHRGLPPALILTAGFDPLQDDGKAYAEKLRAAGVPVEFHCYEDMIHCFINLGMVTLGARRALDQCAQSLRMGLS